MTSFSEARRNAIAARFPVREELTKDAMWSAYFAELPRNDVVDVLTLLEEELVVSVGLLRPDDSLTALLAPVLTWNPWRWVRHRSIENDHVMEVRHQLVLRRERHGDPLPHSDVRSVGDFIRAWCRPPHLSNER